MTKRFYDKILFKSFQLGGSDALSWWFNVIISSPALNIGVIFLFLKLGQRVASSKSCSEIGGLVKGRVLLESVFSNCFVSCPSAYEIH